MAFRGVQFRAAHEAAALAPALAVLPFRCVHTPQPFCIHVGSHLISSFAHLQDVLISWTNVCLLSQLHVTG